MQKPYTEARRDQLEAQRELVLSDFEKKLGKDRYAKFRAVGGLGLLSDVMTCER